MEHEKKNERTIAQDAAGVGAVAAGAASAKFGIDAMRSKGERKETRKKAKDKFVNAKVAVKKVVTLESKENKSPDHKKKLEDWGKTARKNKNNSIKEEMRLKGKKAGMKNIKLSAALALGSAGLAYAARGKKDEEK